MKKILALILCLTMTVMADARSLILVLSDSTQVYYLLGGEKNPVMKCGKESITVDTDKYAFQDVVKFFLSDKDAPDAINDMTIPGLTYDGSTLYVNSSVKSVNVYRIDGIEVEVKTAISDGRTAISTSSLERGTYVVKIGKASMKIHKK